MSDPVATSELTLPAGLPEELSKRIIPEVDYTAYDEILQSIGANICTCKYSLGISNNSVMFNDHFYDSEMFQQAQQMSYDAWQRKLEVRPNARRYFRCPIRNKRYPYDSAMKTRLKTTMSRPSLAELIHRRLPSVSTEDAMTYFVPVARGAFLPNMHVNQFVTFIRNHLTARQRNHQQYASFIRSREIAAHESTPVQKEVRTAAPALPIARHPDRNLNSDVQEAIRQSLGATSNSNRENLSRLRADIDDGSSVSSTSDSDDANTNTRETRQAIRNFLASDSEESDTNIGQILENDNFEGIVGVVPPTPNNESNSTPMISNVSESSNLTSTSTRRNINSVVGEIVNHNHLTTNTNTTTDNDTAEYHVFNTDLEHEDRIVIRVPVQPGTNLVNNVTNEEQNKESSVSTLLQTTNTPDIDSNLPPDDTNIPSTEQSNMPPAIVEVPNQANINDRNTSLPDTNVARMPDSQENDNGQAMDNNVARKLSPSETFMRQQAANSIAELTRIWDSQKQAASVNEDNSQKQAASVNEDNEKLLSNFTDKPEHQSICVSILSLANSMGYENTLEKGKRQSFFIENVKKWYEPGGLLEGHKVNCPKVIQRKFFLAQNAAKLLYSARSHAPSDAQDETLPVYVKSFFHYFDWLAEKQSHKNPAQLAREENLRLNRTIVGQQPALNSTNMLEYNNTAATPGRERGTGDIAGETIIRTSTNNMNNPNAISDINDSSSMSNTSLRQQRRRNASTICDTFPRNMRPRRLNMHGGISPRAVLPPSTSQDSGFEVNDLFSRYNSLASSMEGLGTMSNIKTILSNQRFRPIHEINAEIMKFEKEKFDLEQANNQETAYYRSIDDTLQCLREEINNAKCLDSIYLNVAINANNKLNNGEDQHDHDNDPNTPNSLPHL